MTKTCTSIEQSKKLLNLGLDPSTADMYYIQMMDEDGCYDEAHIWVAETAEEKLQCEAYKTPAWSLIALLEMIPLYTLEQTTDGKVIVVSEIGQYSKCSEAWDCPIDAAFEMVCWLKEQRYIKVNK